MGAGPEDPQKIHYQAESPDEAALVAAAREFGFFFFRRTNTTVLVRESGADAEFEILNILEFDSTRKRMSVICRAPEGQIRLYCKARRRRQYTTACARMTLGAKVMWERFNFQYISIPSLVTPSASAKWLSSNLTECANTECLVPGRFAKHTHAACRAWTGWSL